MHSLAAPGITLSILLPFVLAWFGLMLGIFWLQYRYEERMEAARQRDYQVRDERYRVIQGAQG
jgi:hypothetical protein